MANNDDLEKESQTVFKEEDTSNAKDNKSNQAKTASGLEENVAGLLCYLVGFVTGIVFLIIEKENRFIRFHALQSITTFGVIFVANIVLTFIPFIGFIISLLLIPLTLILWIVLMMKAYKGEMFRLPMISNFVDQQLNKGDA